MEESLNKYAEQFDENFPIFLLRNKTENEVIQIVQKCLESNEPYKVEDDKDSDY